MYRVRVGTKGILFKDLEGDTSRSYITQKELLVPITDQLSDTLVLLPGSPFWGVAHPPQESFDNHYGFRKGDYILVVGANDVEYLFSQF